MIFTLKYLGGSMLLSTIYFETKNIRWIGGWIGGWVDG